ncbi:hypothetical protein ACSAGD_12025 [Paramicrobacterium sp. CJ85]
MQIVTSPNAAVRAARIARHIERLAADARSQNRSSDNENPF